MNSTITASLPAPAPNTNISRSREMSRLLLLSMAFSCLLVLARMAHTRHSAFLGLIWNLWLAYIPYLMTSRICLFRIPDPATAPTSPTTMNQAGRRPRRASKWAFPLLFCCWLLFIPNSFYILTDLFHLNDRFNDRLAPQWFDLALILSFAWNGLLLGILSVRHMEKLLLPQQNQYQAFLFAYPIMWLNALGIYIGRYMRYNSWDIITDPFALFRDIFHIVARPLHHSDAWGMVLCYSVLMTIMYLMLRRISRIIA